MNTANRQFVEMVLRGMAALAKVNPSEEDLQKTVEQVVQASRRFETGEKLYVLVEERDNPNPAKLTTRSDGTVHVEIEPGERPYAYDAPYNCPKLRCYRAGRVINDSGDDDVCFYTQPMMNGGGMMWVPRKFLITKQELDEIKKNNPTWHIFIH